MDSAASIPVLAWNQYGHHGLILSMKQKASKVGPLLTHANALCEVNRNQSSVLAGGLRDEDCQLQTNAAS